MKILEINTEKTWRGGERQTLYTLEGLSDAGNTVFLLCAKGSPLSQKAKNAGFKTIEIKAQAAIFFHLLFHVQNYDIIHVQNAKALIWAVLARFFSRKPVVYTRRVDFVPRGFFTIWKYRKADKIVAISRAIQRILEKQGINDVEVIPSMIKPAIPENENAKKLLTGWVADKKKIIATTAAFVPHKDPRTMVKAIAELKKIRSDFVFLHFGDGELLDEIKQEAEKLNIREYYIFMGFRNDVEDFFPLMNVFVMSSQEEGLGSSVLDAFVNGVAVVTTDAGGLKETVEGCGLLSPVKDERALAENINRLLEDEKLRLSLTAKARLRVDEKYSVKTNIAAYMNLFEKLHPTKL